jgi:hypothetical protein
MNEGFDEGVVTSGDWRGRKKRESAMFRDESHRVVSLGGNSLNVSSSCFFAETCRPARAHFANSSCEIRHWEERDSRSDARSDADGRSQEREPHLRRYPRG